MLHSLLYSMTLMHRCTVIFVEHFEINNYWTLYVNIGGGLIFGYKAMAL